MAYENPPAAIAHCMEKGFKTYQEVFWCAVDRKPKLATAAWLAVTKRLVREEAGLKGAKRRAKRNTRRRRRSR